MGKKAGGPPLHSGYVKPSVCVPKDAEHAYWAERQQMTRDLRAKVDKPPRKAVNARFSDDQVREIRKDLIAMTPAKVAKKWQCKYDVIINIRDGVNYARVK